MATYNIEALRNRDGFGAPLEEGFTQSSENELGLAVLASMSALRGIAPDEGQPVQTNQAEDGNFGFALYP